MVVDAPARPSDPIAAALQAADARARGATPRFNVNLPLPSGETLQMSVPMALTQADALFAINYFSGRLPADMNAQMQRQAGMVRVPAGFKVPEPRGGRL